MTWKYIKQSENYLNENTREFVIYPNLQIPFLIALLESYQS